MMELGTDLDFPNMTTTEATSSEISLSEEKSLDSPPSVQSPSNEFIIDQKTESAEEVKKDEIETVETITRRLREKAAREAAEAKLKAQIEAKDGQATNNAADNGNTEGSVSENYESFEVIDQQVMDLDEKRRLQNRGRYVGINRGEKNKFAPKNFRRVESIDPPANRPDYNSVVFNLSNNVNGLVPAFDPNSQGNVSWNDLKLDINSSNKGVGYQRKPGQRVEQREWKKGASDGVTTVETLEEELDKEETEDQEIVSTADVEDEISALEPEVAYADSAWPGNATNAYFQPQAQSETGQGYWNSDEGYPYGANGEWYHIYSELEEIRRQMKLFQKLPEQIKKIQREVQEIDKNVKSVLKNVTKDPEEDSGRVQNINAAKNTERLVSIPAGTKVLVLTDSICSRMNGYKINSDLKVCVRSYGGLTVTEMITIISTLDEDVCYDVDYVFLHVGTNDLGCEDLPSLKSEFKTLIKRALKIFSNGTIFMSAILPRYGTYRELKDRQEFNDLIANLAEKYNRVQYVDASSQFVSRNMDNTLDHELYKRDFIHLKLKGMGVLAGCFRQVLDMHIQQNEGSMKSVNNSYSTAAMAANSTNNNSSIFDTSECSTAAALDLGGQNQYSAQATSGGGGASAGYGDRSATASVPPADATGSLHCGPPGTSFNASPGITSVQLGGGNSFNANRQRISGRYTQYRR